MTYLEQHKVDHCHTAQDVRDAALKVLARRRVERTPPKVIPKIILLELVKRAQLVPQPVIVLEPFIPPDPITPYVSIGAIQRAVAKKFNISLNDMFSRRRTANLVMPRQIAYLLSKLLTLKSFPAIGRCFDNRDHTAIMHGIRKLNWLEVRLRAELQPTDFLSTWVNRAHELVTEGEK